MKCVEAALKSSFRKETAPKLSPQTFLEELSVFNAQNVATSCDDLFVDELLDFSHEEELLLKEEQQEQEQEQPQQQQQQNHVFISVSPQQNQTQQIFNDNFASLPTSELTVPAEEAANLEWLSHFVEDSFLEHSNSFPIPIGTLTVTEKVTAKATETTVNLTEPCFKTPVPAKARSKRTRSGVRVWPPLKSPSFTDSSSSSSSSSSSETNLPEKKAKVRVVAEGEPRSGSPRRCSHCGVQKTPQWRAGPLGAKTLCNACGVRFKSGRLLPEYRPACSPTFSSELHSNHHRKVLEMRRMKEVTGAGPETGLTTLPVSGF